MTVESAEAGQTDALETSEAAGGGWKRRGVLRAVALRLLALPPTLIVLVTFSFLITAVLPSNPARVVLGDMASGEAVAEFNHELGLDQPVIEQYFMYWGRLLRGDLGTSFYSGLPVGDEIAHRAGSTLALIVSALILAFAMGVGIALVGTRFPGRFADRSGSFVVSVSQSIPPFVLGIVLLYLLSYQFGIAPPPSGQQPLAAETPPQVTGVLAIDMVLAGRFSELGSVLSHMALPVTALAFGYLAFFARITRPALETAMASDQVQFARTLGLSEARVLHYGWLEARVPVIAYSGQLFAEMLGATAILETIFSWNGLGQWAITSILKLDIPSIQGFVLVAGTATFVVFFALDFIAKALDPRIRYDRN